MNFTKLTLFGTLLSSLTIAASINSACLTLSDKFAGMGVKDDGDAFAVFSNFWQLSNTDIDENARFFSFDYCTGSDGNLALAQINLSASDYGAEDASKVKLDSIG